MLSRWRLAQRRRHARMIFTGRAVGRSLRAKTTAATSNVTGSEAMNAAVVMAVPLDGLGKPSVSFPFWAARSGRSPTGSCASQDAPATGGRDDEGPGLRSAGACLWARKTPTNVTLHFRSRIGPQHAGVSHNGRVDLAG